MSEAWMVAFASVVLAHFGSLPTLIQKSNPWRGFQAEGPALLNIRAERVNFKASGTRCDQWVRALSSIQPGVLLGPKPDEKSWREAAREWGAWSREEASGIQACDQNPCDIKLSSAEISEMKKVPSSARLEKYLRVIEARSAFYLQTGQRREYEFPGAPIDPWLYFEKKGLNSDLRPTDPASLWARKVRLSDEKTKLLHQIVDQRVTVASNKMSAAVWLRDAYTDHYFDSWGEWSWVRCDAEGVVILQALFLELDLLKKEDLISKLMRNRMRQEAEEHGAIYLNQNFLNYRSQLLSNLFGGKFDHLAHGFSEGFDFPFFAQVP